MVKWRSNCKRSSSTFWNTILYFLNHQSWYFWRWPLQDILLESGVFAKFLSQIQCLRILGPFSLKVTKLDGFSDVTIVRYLISFPSMKKSIWMENFFSAVIQKNCLWQQKVLRYRDFSDERKKERNATKKEILGSLVRHRKSKSMERKLCSKGEKSLAW